MTEYANGHKNGNRVTWRDILQLALMLLSVGGSVLVMREKITALEKEVSTLRTQLQNYPAVVGYVQQHDRDIRELRADLKDRREQ